MNGGTRMITGLEHCGDSNARWTQTFEGIECLENLEDLNVEGLERSKDSNIPLQLAFSLLSFTKVWGGGD